MVSPQLYLISPPSIDLPVFRKQLEEALSAGKELDSRFRGNDAFIGAFQLRLKDADDDDIKKAIRELMPVVRAHQAAFIINDRADLCAEFKCDGVHIGQEDLLNASGTRSCASHEASLTAGSPADSLAAIRRMVGNDAVIGVTCHASKHLAMQAGEAGADYVAFGAFYLTTSKPKEKLEKWGTPTPDILKWWQEFMTLPCVAIGGITPANCKPLAEAGADFLAVITAVWNHPAGPAAAVKEFERTLS